MMLLGNLDFDFPCFCPSVSDVGALGVEEKLFLPSAKVAIVEVVNISTSDV